MLRELYEPAFLHHSTTEVVKAVRLHPEFTEHFTPAAKEETAVELDPKESQVQLTKIEIITIRDNAIDTPPKSWDHRIEDNGVLALLVILTLLVLFILVVLDAVG